MKKIGHFLTTVLFRFPQKIFSIINKMCKTYMLAVFPSAYLYWGRGPYGKRGRVNFMFGHIL